MAITTDIGSADTTIDVIAIMVIAIVIGFIVYEISTATESVSDSSGGFLGLGAAFLAGILLF
jgi:hypothetical protein